MRVENLMSSVLTGPALTVRIYKNLTTNPALAWANTYEFITNYEGSIVPGDLVTLCQTLANAESHIHADKVHFTRGVVSDGEPYDPSTFYAVPLNSYGVRSTAASEIMSLQNCYRVAKVVDLGRQGFFLYRGVLTEGDVTSPAGVPTLAGSLGQAFTDYVSGMQPLLTGTGNFAMSMIGNIYANSRSVRNLVEAGVTVKKYNNRYFDKVNR
jgi:hypothetical protein